MNKYHHFFTQEVPLLLRSLKADAEPAWGSMNVTQMLDHLRRGVLLSLQGLTTEIVTPQENLPRLKAFLMSDKPFRKHSDMPEAYHKIKGFKGAIEDQKVELMKTVVEMLTYFDNNPDHTAIHPNFGVLNTEEWLQLHRKHFMHHFTQFGLLEDAQ